MTIRYAHPMNHGAEILADGHVRFRIWGPTAQDMQISLDGAEPAPMQRDEGDWFCATLPAEAGTRYQFVLPDGTRVPDPTSRLQAGDVHDASVVVDPRAYRWINTDWRGRPWSQTVLYEVHPGAAGGFAGLTALLPRLKDTGITAVELMPINDFPGRHNWGYDGVLPYAPDTAYGTPDELKQLIDTAHGLGLMVFLDVVYNHFGPDGAYIHSYANSFFTEEFCTPWGAGIDFRRDVVQDYFADNALYWLNEYRFDGLRFDALGAVQPQEALVTLAARIRAGIEPGRQVHLVMEHEFNAASLLRSSFDAQWADDIHHALHVLLTGETHGYYEDFVDATALFARCLQDGFAYQGEISRHSGNPRGEPSGDLPTTAFVAFVQNHDQIGNRALGDRITASAAPAANRAARAFLLLSPFIPLLFMGEEWATRQPFMFFTDHHDELAELVRRGRRSEFAAFAANAGAEIPDPNHPDTFCGSRIDFAEADQPGYAEELALTRHLLTLRHARIAPYLDDTHSIGAEVLGPNAVQGAWRLNNGAVLTIALNLGAEPVACQPPACAILYATEPAPADTLLPSHSIAVWLSDAAA